MPITTVENMAAELLVEYPWSEIFVWSSDLYLPSGLRKGYNHCCEHRDEAPIRLQCWNLSRRFEDGVVHA
jgi:hypothetical protein